MDEDDLPIVAADADIGDVDADKTTLTETFSVNQNISFSPRAEKTTTTVIQSVSVINEIQSSSCPKSQEIANDKENDNSADVSKPVSSSWLVFNGASNLFNDSDDESSPISLPDLPAVPEMEDENILRLDGSSLIDDDDVASSHERSKSSETGDTLKKFEDDFSESQLEKRKKKKKHKKKRSKSGQAELDELGDADSSDELADGKERKKSKRLSKKEIKKMHSDAQRVLREAPVSIPIRRSEPLNLDDILQEVASVNPEVRKIIEKENEKKEERIEEDKKDVPQDNDNPTGDLTDVTEDKTKTENVAADDSDDVELEIVDDDVVVVKEERPASEQKKPVKNPGISWLMERFKRHSLPAKKPGHSTTGELGSPEGPAATWDDVKGQLVQEMAALREKSLQERIERYKMENYEELGADEEEPDVESVSGGSSENDDSYTTISDEEEYEVARKERRKKSKSKKTKNSADKATLGSEFLNREAMETGSEDEDYEPSEGHRDDENCPSTDSGSISSEDEKVRSDSDDDDDGSYDEHEIGDDTEENGEASDEEEEILRARPKKKTKSKKRHQENERTHRFDSDDDSDDEEKRTAEAAIQENDDDLPELAVESRPLDTEVNPTSLLDPGESSNSTSSSAVIPPDMPSPKELFNIYDDPFAAYNSANKEGSGRGGPTEMDELLGLCTGPFTKSTIPHDEVIKPKLQQPPQTLEASDVSSSDEEEEVAFVSAARRVKHVYGKSQVKSASAERSNSHEVEYSNEAVTETVKFSKKKEKGNSLVREYFEAEAELSDSDPEAAAVSTDEDEGGDDSYETDPEFEDEALDKLTGGQLQKQVEAIHMKQVIDEDERDLLHLREVIMPDADMEFTGPRLRRFQWADAFRDLGAGMDSASQGDNPHADDDYLGLGALDTAVAASSTSLSSMWHKKRVEREQWLQNQQETQPAVEESEGTLLLSVESETATENVNAGSQLVRFGMSAMRKSTGASVLVTETSTSTFAVPRRSSHGSMLSSLQQKELDKIAQTVAPATSGQKRRPALAPGAGGANPKPEELMAAPSLKSRSSAGPFIVVCGDSPSTERKRKIESATFNSTSSASASKRGKPQQSSVFDYLP